MRWVVLFMGMIGFGLGSWAKAEEPTPPRIPGWQQAKASCPGPSIEWEYQKGPLTAKVRLRALTATGFTKTESFTIAYVWGDEQKQEDEQVVKDLTAAVAAELKKIDKGQFKDSLPCQILAKLTKVPPGRQPYHHHNKYPLSAVTEALATTGVLLLFLAGLACLPAVWKWWKLQGHFFRMGVLVLVAISLAQSLGEGIILDELFHGPWRVEDSRAIPISWGYYPAGVNGVMWWALRWLPPTMELAFWVNRIFGVITVVSLCFAVTRMGGKRAGLLAGALAAGSPWLALHARSDTEMACAMAAMGIYLCSLTIKGRSGPWLSGLAFWFLLQQRPEAILWLPLIFLAQLRRAWMGHGFAFLVHLPYLLGPFLQKTLYMSGGLGNRGPLLSKLPQLLGLGGSVPNPGVNLLPLALLWGLAFWGAWYFYKRKKDNRLLVLVLPTFVVCLSFLTHGTGNPKFGELRYAMNFLPYLWATVALALTSIGNRGLLIFAGVVGITFLIGRPNGSLPPSVQDQEWAFLMANRSKLSQPCQIELPPHSHPRKNIDNPTPYAARPLFAMSWGKVHCDLYQPERSLHQKNHTHWIYLGPYCYRFTPGMEPACQKVMEEARGRIVGARIKVHQDLRSLRDEFDEKDFWIGFVEIPRPEKNLEN